MFFNSTLYTIAAEMFPLHLRGYGSGVSSMFQGVSNIWMSQITTYAFDAIKWKSYFVFIACLVVPGFFYAFYLIETNQVSLEQIAGKFGDTTISLEKASAVQDESMELSADPAVSRAWDLLVIGTVKNTTSLGR
ncbi:MFS sugar transporter [Fusarium oxysporum f. sp. phaseoli]